MPSKDDGYSRLWLKPFSSTTPRMKIMEKIGSGLSGYVFKVRIDGVTYALKMASETLPTYAQSIIALKISISSNSSTQISVHPFSKEQSF